MKENKPRREKTGLSWLGVCTDIGLNDSCANVRDVLSKMDVGMCQSMRVDVFSWYLPMCFGGSVTLSVIGLFLDDCSGLGRVLGKRTKRREGERGRSKREKEGRENDARATGNNDGVVTG